MVSTAVFRIILASGSWGKVFFLEFHGVGSDVSLFGGFWVWLVWIVRASKKARVLGDGGDVYELHAYRFGVELGEMAVRVDSRLLSKGVGCPRNAPTAKFRIPKPNTKKQALLHRNIDTHTGNPYEISNCSNFPPPSRYSFTQFGLRPLPLQFFFPSLL